MEWSTITSKNFLNKTPVNFVHNELKHLFETINLSSIEHTSTWFPEHISFLYRNAVFPDLVPHSIEAETNTFASSDILKISIGCLVFIRTMNYNLRGLWMSGLVR